MNEKDVYWAKLSEEYKEGHEIMKDRPVIVIKNFAGKGMAFVIPLSTSEKRANDEYTVVLEPSLENGLNDFSVAIVYQALSISKKRLIKRVGNIDNDTFVLIKENLRKYLGL